MIDEQQVEELLAIWEDHWQQGRPLTAEELCADCPQFIVSVRAKIEALQQIYEALSPTTENPDDTVGDRFEEDLPRPDGFQCQGYLGQGGAGIVYKAWQAKLSRFVALKLIRDHAIASPNRLQRFRAEAKAAAQLQHPNIVQIYDVGEYRGRPFLALEYLAGGTLAERVRGVPQEPIEAATFVECLARAVHHAHNRGVVHRDLKPANVLLEESPSDEADGTSSQAARTALSSMSPKISDFGLAKFLDESAPLTFTGDVMGTPSYMAPEQAEGRAADIGPLTDVHALGIILYELLTGRPPFASPTTMETLTQLKTREAVPPTHIQPGIPADLENICLKCLQKEPHRRYASAQSLAEDLHRFVGGMPVHARAIGRPQRVWRWSRRNPEVATLATLLLVAIVAGFALVTWKWVESDRARRRADANFREIRRAVDDYLVLVSEDVLLNEQAMQPLRERLLTTALQYYEEFLQDHAGDPALEAELVQIRAKVGKIKAVLGSSEQARQHLQEALDWQRELVRRHPQHMGFAATLTEIQNDLGLLFSRLGDLDQAEFLLREAVRGGEAIAAEPSLTAEQRNVLATSYHYLGMAVHERQGQIEQAAKSFRSAVDVASQVLAKFSESEKTQQQMADSYERLGLQQMELGDHKRAEQSLQTAVELHQHLVETHPQTIDYRSSLSEAHNSLGSLWARQGNLPAAVEAFQQAVAIDRQLSEDNPRVIRFRMALLFRLLNLGGVLRDSRLTDQAIACNESALQLGQELYDEAPEVPARGSSMGLILNNLAAIQADLGNRQAAVELYQRAVNHLQPLVDSRETLVPDRDRLALTYFNLGRNQHRIGRIPEAIGSLHNAIQHSRYLVGSSPETAKYQHRLAMSLKALSQIHREAGDSDSGRQSQVEAIEILEVIASGQHVAVVDFKNDLAQAYLDQSSSALDLQDPARAQSSLSAAEQLLNELAAHPRMEPDFRAAMANSLLAMGLIQRRTGKPKVALEYYQRAMGIAEDLIEELPEIVRYQVILAKSCNNAGLVQNQLRRPKLARPLVLRAIDILEGLDADLPATRQRKNSLAGSFNNLGFLRSEAGDHDKALASYQKAIELWQSVVAGSESSRARVGLAAARGNVGHIYYGRGKPQEALVQYDLGLEQLEAMLNRKMSHYSADSFRKSILWGRARALNKLKRYKEAAEDWQQVLSLTKPRSQRLFQMELAWSLAKSGDHRTAVKIADALERENGSEAEILVNCARLYSLAIAAAENDDGLGPDRSALLQQYENRAIDLLKRVEELAQLHQPEKIDDLRTNRDFQALHSRDSFKQLLESLQATRR